MDYQTLDLIGPEDGVLEVVIRAGKRNALDARGHRELATVWRDLEARPGVRAVLLYGGGGVFSAGGDLDLVEAMARDFDLRARVWKEARDLVVNILEFPLPVVAAVEGAAAGAGLAAALAADIAVVAEDAVLIDAHTRLGLAAGDHAALLWPLLVGMARAKYHLLLNEPLTGADAERIGLVAKSVPAGEAVPTARALARRLARGSRTAIGWTKHALNGWWRMALPIFDASLALEFLGFSGPDLREGIRAFREKREPSFEE